MILRNCVLTYVCNSLHQTHKYHSIERNPKKIKRDNNDTFGYETPKKKKHSPFTDSCCATALCFDLGRVNTACDDLPVPGRQHSLSLNPL